MKYAPIVLAVFLLMGCSSSGSEALDEAFTSSERHILATADRVEILSLEPPTEGGSPEPEVSDARFHGFDIHQRAEVSKENGRRLIDSFLNSAKRGDLHVGAACFIPHHAIRVWSGTDYVDIVVCFMCNNFYVYPGGFFNGLHLTGEHESVWQAVFAENKVEVPDHEYN